GYPGYVAGATFAQALGWNGAQVASSYAACASGVTALATARAQILAGFCDVALVIGADTTPKGFLAPNKGERGDDPDWLRFRLLARLRAPPRHRRPRASARDLDGHAELSADDDRAPELRDRQRGGRGCRARTRLQGVDRSARVRRGRPRARRPRLCRGLRPLD